jgi:DNA mismatch repair protein MutS2
MWLRKKVNEEVTVHEEIRKEKKEKKLEPVMKIPKAIIRLRSR